MCSTYSSSSGDCGGSGVCGDRDCDIGGIGDDDDNDYANISTVFVWKYLCLNVCFFAYVLVLSEFYLRAPLFSFFCIAPAVFMRPVTGFELENTLRTDPPSGGSVYTLLHHQQSLSGCRICLYGTAFLYLA
jgi:hypothetical protein